MRVVMRGVSSTGNAYDGCGRSNSRGSAARTDDVVRARHSLRVATTEEDEEEWGVDDAAADDDATTDNDDEDEYDARPSLILEKAVEATGANAARNKIRRRAIIVVVLLGIL